MSGPGSGRYTTYTPVKSAKYERLKQEFNDRYGTRADIYPGSAPFDNSSVSRAAADLFLKNRDKDPKDAKGVYSGTEFSLKYENSPNIPAGEDIHPDKSAGDPSNSYFPSLASPGAKASGVNVDPSTNDPVKITDIKPNFTSSDLSGGTANPAETAKKIAKSILDSKT